MYIPPNWLSSIQNDPMAKKASLWGFQIFGVLLMLFAPMDVLAQYPFLAMIVDFVSGLVPSINKWAEHSPWPQVTRLFFTYCWLTLPFQLVIMTNYVFKLKAVKPKFSLYKRIIIISFFLLFVVCWLVFTYFFAIPYTESTASYGDDPYKSKLIQSLYGVLMAFSNAFLVSLILLFIKKIKAVLHTNIIMKGSL